MNELAILVPSCDKYSDTWKPFFHFFWKYWIDCPFEVYLGTNYKEFDYPKVNVIKIGEDKGWAGSTKEMLKAINSKYVLLFLEDYFIYECQTNKILQAHEIFKRLNARYMKLTPDPKPDIKVSEYPLIGKIKEGARYKTSIGIEIWDVHTLLSLLVDGESAWDMEIKGSERAKNLDGFYRTWNPLVKFHNAIVCGTWRRHAIRYCRRNGIEIDTSHRPVFGIPETFWISVKSLIRRTISRLPEPLFTITFNAGRKTLSLFRK